MKKRLLSSLIIVAVAVLTGCEDQDCPVIPDLEGGRLEFYFGGSSRTLQLVSEVSWSIDRVMGSAGQPAPEWLDFSPERVGVSNADGNYNALVIFSVREEFLRNPPPEGVFQVTAECENSSPRYSARVLDPPRLSVDSTLDLSAASPQRSARVGNDGQGVLRWSAMSTDLRVSVSPDNGATTLGEFDNPQFPPSNTVDVRVTDTSESFAAEIIYMNLDIPDDMATTIVNFDAAAPPSGVLEVAPSSISIPQSDTVTVSNSGTASLTWTATPADNRLSVTPASGMLDPSGSETVTIEVLDESTAFASIISFRNDDATQSVQLNVSFTPTQTGVGIFESPSVGNSNTHRFSSAAILPSDSNGAIIGGTAVEFALGGMNVGFVLGVDSRIDSVLWDATIPDLGSQGPANVEVEAMDFSSAGYIVAATRRDTANDLDTGYLYETNQSGVMQWNVTLGDGFLIDGARDGDENLADVLTVADGYLALGRTLDIVGAGFEFLGYLAKVSLAGDLVWETSLRIPSAQFIPTAFVLGNGDRLFITGFDTFTDAGMPSSYLVVTEPLGNNPNGPPAIEQVTEVPGVTLADIVETQTGLYAATGQDRATVGPAIVVFNQDGSFNQAAVFNESIGNINPGGLAEDNDGNLVIAGVLTPAKRKGEVASEEGYLAGIEGDLSARRWIRRYDPGESSQLFAVTIANDGDILATGATVNQGVGRILVVRTDTAGNPSSPPAR